MKYRSDIQVARGYSIIIIVLYHCNIILYGYNAVIIFITISGYFTNVSKKCIVLPKRYLRLLMPSITSLVIILIIYHNDIQREQFYNFFSEFLSTILLYSNYYFIASSTDYFNPPENSILLHNWYISVDMHFHLINALIAINSKVFYISLSFISFFIYIITFDRIKSYNYFSSIPRLWQFLFSKTVLFKYQNILIKYACIAFLISIIIYSNAYISEIFYQLLIVIAISLYLCNSVDIKIYLLSLIGNISYYIYLVHYPIIKLDVLDYLIFLKILILSFVLYIIYDLYPITKIFNYKYSNLVLLVIEVYILLYLGTNILTKEEIPNLESKLLKIKIIIKNNYCCYKNTNSFNNHTVLFIGDSHVFNLLGNYYYLFKDYKYTIYYKYIHTEFIVRNNSNIYDITDFFHIIVNMNLFYDNKHEEYLKYYPIKIISYLKYLKEYSDIVFYFIPTPVLKNRISCKNQMNYIARNGTDILIFPFKLKKIKNIIFLDITHLFCNFSLCSLNYKNNCIYSDEHHFTFSFYKSIMNYTTKLISPYLIHNRTNIIDNNTCEYYLYKNKILRAWKYKQKECNLQLYY